MNIAIEVVIFKVKAGVSDSQLQTAALAVTPPHPRTLWPANQYYAMCKGLKKIALDVIYGHSPIEVIRFKQSAGLIYLASE